MKHEPIEPIEPIMSQLSEHEHVYDKWRGIFGRKNGHDVIWDKDFLVCSCGAKIDIPEIVRRVNAYPAMKKFIADFYSGNLNASLELYRLPEDVIDAVLEARGYDPAALGERFERLADKAIKESPLVPKE